MRFGLERGDWQAVLKNPEGSRFEVYENNILFSTIDWSLIGKHNVKNALAAAAISDAVGISGEVFSKALASFKSVKRRLELKGVRDGVAVYDDFAHHPTAIRTTLEGLRKKVGAARIHAVLECRSYTMRTGVHRNSLGPALAEADTVTLLQAEHLAWDLGQVKKSCRQACSVFSSLEELVEHVKRLAKSGDHILVMSNGGFGGVHEKLLKR